MRDPSLRTPLSSFLRSGLARRRPVVLMYHGFAAEPRTDDPENLFVTATDFETQLDHLLGHGWTPLDLDGFLAARTSGGPGKRFLVTIDDGLESVLRIAVPVLEARAVPALLFVPAGMVGRTAEWLPEPAHEPLLDADQLRTVVRGGLVEVGAHGFEHVDLSRLGPDDLSRQTARACRDLEELVGAPVRAFAYPFGDHDARTREAVAGAGCVVAFSVFDDVGAFAVSRVDVNATDGPMSFRLKLVPGYRWWWRVLGRAAVVRRLVRRVATSQPRRVPMREKS